MQLEGKLSLFLEENFEVEVHLADMTFTKKTLDWEYKVEIIDWVKEFTKKKVG